MRVLITGCKGQLGMELTPQLTGIGRGYEVIETDIHNLDITDEKTVFAFIGAQKPDVIINCAACTNVDGCEMDEAYAFLVNAIGARNLSAAAFNIGSKIVHLSSDYVFDGQGHIPKKEFDSVAPVNCYGRSKEYGERLVRETNPRHFIIRTAWLFGEGNNFVRTMLRLSKKKKELDIVNDQIGTPTSTVDLAACIAGLMATDAYGTYHATCEGECSWFEFAKKIFELKAIEIKVNPVTSKELARPAHRPGYSVLDNFMLRLCGMNNFRHWEESLEEYLK